MNRRWHLTLLMILLALVLRGRDIGNPVLGLDEQWYLLVGDRMLHGAAPFVDLWDRKPVGLFLLYAALRLLPGDGIVAYQLAAAICAGLTAALVGRVAVRIGAGARGCYAAGLLYLLTIAVIGGQGGQAPVFYNLLVAAAMLVTMRLPTLAAAHATGRIAINGLVACALAGLAIQIKYTVVFEAAFVGAAHLWAIRRAGGSWPRTIALGAGWALVGLLPTLAAIGAYAAMGAPALGEFWFANFVSIALRHGLPVARLAANLGSIAGQVAPLLVAAAVAIVAAWRARPLPPRFALALWWLAAAAAGFACIGTFYDHYALPLLPPLAVVAATALDRSRWLLGAAVVGAVAIFAGDRLRQADDASSTRAVAAVVRAESGGRCPYVFMGDPIIYHLAGACIPTRYAFPNTLAQGIEQGATGIDEAAEVARIMRAAPPVVVVTDRPRTIWNVASRRIVTAAIARDYRLRLVVPRSRWRTFVYVRRAGR